jgi:hypothetical protein
VNAEFADQSSDHDPQVVRLTLLNPFDNVCRLARAYSSKRAVAGLVCTEIAVAKAADARGNRIAKKVALRVATATVRRESGRAFTPGEANELIGLIAQL